MEKSFVKSEELIDPNEKDESDYLLKFERKLLEEMIKHKNCLVLLGIGFSIPRAIGSLLLERYSSYKETDNHSPYLIFVVNFRAKVHTEFYEKVKLAL